MKTLEPVALTVLLVAGAARAQVPQKVDWFSVATKERAILFRPGQEAEVRLKIKPGAGTSLFWKLVNQSEQVLKEAGGPAALAPDGESVTRLPLGALPEGFYVVRFKTIDKGRTVRRGVVPVGVFGPIPPPDGAVTEPFFPFGVYDKYVISQDPVISNTYLHAICREMRKAGLNTITSGNALGHPTSIEALDIAHRYGIRVMLRLGSAPGEAARRHPAVLVFMYGDEPSMEHLPQYKQTYDDIQAKYPDKSLATCLIADAIGSGNDHDPLRIWPVLKPRLRFLRVYPVRKLNYDGLLRARIFTGDILLNAGFLLTEHAAETPWWFIPQGFGAQPTDLRPLPYWRNPTGAELKGMVHLALAYGASGIMTYSLQTHMGTEAKPTPSLLTQETLAPEDDKYAAYVEMARFVTRVKARLLGAKPGGREVVAERWEVEAVPRQDAEGRPLVYLVNKDSRNTVETAVWAYGAPLLAVTDLGAGRPVTVGAKNGRPAAWVTLGPGDGCLWELSFGEGPLPVHQVNTAQQLTFLSDTITPLGPDEHDVYRVVQPAPRWWKFRVDDSDAGRTEQWFAPDFDDRDWGCLEAGKFWDRQGVKLTGVGWYRVAIAPSAEALKTKPLRLLFQGVDESAWVYLNGEPVCVHYPDSTDGWDRTFTVDVTGKLKPGCANLVAVRVLNRSAAGGIFGKVALVTPTGRRKPE